MAKSKTADKLSRYEILEILRRYHQRHDFTVEWFCSECWTVSELTQKVKEIEQALTACAHHTDIDTGQVLDDEAIQKRRERKAAEMARDGIDYYRDTDVQADEGRFLNVAFADGTFEGQDFNDWMEELQIVGDIRDFRNMYRGWNEADWEYVDGTRNINPRA